MKKSLIFFGVLGAAGAGVWIFRDHILAGILELGGKLSQFTADQTVDVEEDETGPRTIRFPVVEENEV